jgi:type II secretory ATPase GspE/PulE/Tfp pilus assembly ATPase PilB-like protein
MTLMRDDAQRLVRAGVTSAEEVVRVTRDQDVAVHPA